jgi:hypothetical protein
MRFSQECPGRQGALSQLILPRSGRLTRLVERFWPDQLEKSPESGINSVDIHACRNRRRCMQRLAAGMNTVHSWD